MSKLLIEGFSVCNLALVCVCKHTVQPLSGVCIRLTHRLLEWEGLKGRTVACGLGTVSTLTS